MVSGNKKLLFIFLMKIAWNFKFIVPLILSGISALFGHAWMLQIRVNTFRRLREDELAYFSEEEVVEQTVLEDDSDDSWETIQEEEVIG